MSLGKTVKKWLVLAVAALPVPALSATDAALYDVEVLVFENRDPGSDGGEAWKETTGEIPGLDRAAIPEGLPAPDSALSRAVSALERGGRYRVLVHRRWQQAAEAKPEGMPLRLQSAGGELDGTLRFYSSRFLYIEMNLALHGTGAVYPLTEHRRVRLKEIHYFDHPRIGALVRITAAEKPQTPADTPPVRPAR